MRFIIEHPYVFGCTLIAGAIWAICYVLWGRAMSVTGTADVEDE